VNSCLPSTGAGCTMNIRSVGVLCLCLTATATKSTQDSRPPVDLAIIRASVLDVRTGSVLPDRAVLIHRGLITALNRDDPSTKPRAARVVDARGRLLTPGFIDVHLHTALLFGDPTGATHLVMEPDSIEAYRRVFARAYMPYGVTVVRDAGSSERDMPMLLKWMERSPTAPDFYAVGAHLISAQPGRSPLPWQVVVADSTAAAAKVRECYGLGIRNIKLYWRLREPEFKGALFEAQKLGMNVTGHIDLQVMTIDRALDLGLRNFEHIYPIAYSLMTPAGFDSVGAEMPRTLGIVPPRFPPTALFMNAPELWNYLGPTNPRVLALIAKFKADDASLTPTLHVFAQRLGLAYFESAPRDSTEDTSVWTAQQRARAVEGYRVMASYVKRMYSAGIRLNIGTDTPDPGKAVLSEMLLLHDAGIPMADVFRIATLDSAEDIGHGEEYGSIEVGKRADLILFDGNPLENAHDLLGRKTVVKDGVLWSGVD